MRTSKMTSSRIWPSTTLSELLVFSTTRFASLRYTFFFLFHFFSCFYNPNPIDYTILFAASVFLAIKVSDFNWIVLRGWRKSCRGPIWHWNHTRTRSRRIRRRLSSISSCPTSLVTSLRYLYCLFLCFACCSGDFWIFNSESSGMDGKKLFLDFSTFFFDYDVIIFCI